MVESSVMQFSLFQKTDWWVRVTYMDPSLASTFDPEQWFSNNSKNLHRAYPILFWTFKKKLGTKGSLILEISKKPDYLYNKIKEQPNTSWTTQLIGKEQITFVSFKHKFVSKVQELLYPINSSHPKGTSYKTICTLKICQNLQVLVKSFVLWRAGLRVASLHYRV